VIVASFDNSRWGWIVGANDALSNRAEMKVDCAIHRFGEQLRRNWRLVGSFQSGQSNLLALIKAMPICETGTMSRQISSNAYLFH
jgi:hypothetical protein